jgi:hypothetical protein
VKKSIVEILSIGEKNDIYSVCLIYIVVQNNFYMKILQNNFFNFFMFYIITLKLLKIKNILI